jgi:hypothetical protein
MLQPAALAEPGGCTRSHVVWCGTEAKHGTGDICRTCLERVEASCVADALSIRVLSMTGDQHQLPSAPGALFVGRKRELALLRACLAEASAGQGRLVLVSGEPGIGKTRLAEDLAHYAAAQGAAVRWGRCWEGAGAPAFWPWIQVLRAQIKETDPEDLRSQLGAGAGDVAQLLPELHERLVDIAPPLGLLRFVVDEMQGARLLMLATYRDIEVTGEHCPASSRRWATIHG